MIVIAKCSSRTLGALIVWFVASEAVLQYELTSAEQAWTLRLTV